MDLPFQIVAEQSGHDEARTALLDEVMGQNWRRRTSQRLREGRVPESGLCHCALAGGRLVGTVRLWRVRACGLSDALLLGPLAVAAQYQGLGIGRALIENALTKAAEAAHGAVILVGDAPYYGRFGFSAHAARRLAMPGPFERHRLLGMALRPGDLDRAHGVLRPCAPVAAATRVGYADAA